MYGWRADIGITERTRAAAGPLARARPGRPLSEARAADLLPRKYGSGCVSARAARACVLPQGPTATYA